MTIQLDATRVFCSQTEGDLRKVIQPARHPARPFLPVMVIKPLTHNNSRVNPHEALNLADMYSVPCTYIRQMFASIKPLITSGAELIQRGGVYLHSSLNHHQLLPNRHVCEYLLALRCSFMASRESKRYV